jgi:hypothetical protein
VGCGTQTMGDWPTAKATCLRPSAELLGQAGACHWPG